MAAETTTDVPTNLPLDVPSVKAEVEAVFAAYEAALVGNDVATLEALFWDDARTTRYGAGENLYGMEAIRAFRRDRSPQGLARRLGQTVITTFGRDMATAMTLFTRDAEDGRIGRQSQTWVRFPDGWKVVAAHVSSIAARTGSIVAGNRGGARGVRDDRLVDGPLLRPSADGPIAQGAGTRMEKAVGDQGRRDDDHETEGGDEMS